jgi:hypothetical protein
MGSPFGAIHVKGADLPRAIACVEEHLETEGFTRLDEEATPSDFERRVLVFEDGGWVTIADEELVFGEEDDKDLAAVLSKQLKRDAVAIRVFHSDTAHLACYREGRRVGAFQVPEDGQLDAATGHRRVATSFLCDLASDDGARAKLEAGLLADHTFPETTTASACELIGLPRHGAGARYLWKDPPPNGVRLRFEPPQSQRMTLETADWPRSTHDIVVSGTTSFATIVGMPLFENTTITVEACAGERVDGLGIELSGPGLALLNLPEIALPDGG